MPSINIDATHTALNASMSDYITKKIGTLDKFLRDENNVHVEIDIETKKRTGPRYTVKITILPRPGIYAKYTGEDLYEAIDLVIPKIKEQLVKTKDKAISQRRKLGSARKNSPENYEA
jgi:putative sigma-54 modulation protein